MDLRLREIGIEDESFSAFNAFLSFANCLNFVWTLLALENEDH